MTILYYDMSDPEARAKVGEMITMLLGHKRGEIKATGFLELCGQNSAVTDRRRGLLNELPPGGRIALQSSRRPPLLTLVESGPQAAS